MCFSWATLSCPAGTVAFPLCVGCRRPPSVRLYSVFRPAACFFGLPEPAPQVPPLPLLGSRFLLFVALRPPLWLLLRPGGGPSLLRLPFLRFAFPDAAVLAAFFWLACCLAASSPASRCAFGPCLGYGSLLSPLFGGFQSHWLFVLITNSLLGTLLPYYCFCLHWSAPPARSCFSLCLHFWRFSVAACSLCRAVSRSLCGSYARSLSSYLLHASLRVASLLSPAARSVASCSTKTREITRRSYL